MNTSEGSSAAFLQQHQSDVEIASERAPEGTCTDQPEAPLQRPIMFLMFGWDVVFPWFLAIRGF